MKPPFFGTKITADVDISELLSLINKDILFFARWQFKKDAPSKDWFPIYQRMEGLILAKDLILPKIVYGHFRCRKNGNTLFVSVGEVEEEKVSRFDFPRRGQEPLLSVADFFPHDFITMQLVTIGDKIIKEGAKLFTEKKFSEVFYLKGLAAEATDALVEYGDRHIKKELGVSTAQGCRISFGYPAAPDLSYQKKLYDILDAGRIGVKITETYQLIPEYSTSAIISTSPEARLFRP